MEFSAPKRNICLLPLVSLPEEYYSYGFDLSILILWPTWRKYIPVKVDFFYSVSFSVTYVIVYPSGERALGAEAPSVVELGA